MCSRSVLGSDACRAINTVTSACAGGRSSWGKRQGVCSERSVIASGAEEDTLKACIARIPDAASAGQRLSAEQNYAGEDQTRKMSRRHRNCE